MKNSAQLLSTNLLNDHQKLKEIDHWLRVMDRPQGWHYDMDIIWLLQELEKSGLKKGDTIVDAGGGMGVTQFILAARGFNVISLDFSKREYPLQANGIFDIQLPSNESLNYTHEYMGSVNYGTEPVANLNNKKESNSSLVYKTLMKGPVHTLNTIKNLMRKRHNNVLNLREKSLDHTNFGKIKFIRAAFHEIPLEDMSVDALVSVSAIEHADQALMEQNISEMKRIVKEGGPLLITTSANDNDKDTYHNKTLGWCYSINSLSRMASINVLVKFDYKETEKEILNSKLWRSRLDSYYSNDPESEFFKRHMKKLPYLAAGLKIIK